MHDGVNAMAGAAGLGGSDGAAPVVIRGDLIHLTGDPFAASLEDVLTCIPDGAVLCRGGRIKAAGPYAEIARAAPPGAQVHDHRGRLIAPGFVDLHTHYVQTGVMGAHGRQVLDWLTEYVFAEEQRFEDPAYAAKSAAFFCRELLRNGTTTAMVFGAVQPQSADALFEAAMALNMRMVAGKVLMDRHAPDALLDTAQSAYDDSKALIERWHGKGRLGYAVTPRFAPTSTPAQLEAAGALVREHPGVFMQTHLSENEDEVGWVGALFPGAEDYLDVYDRYGLVGPRSVFAHGIHLSEREFARLSGSGAAIAHCPTSNLFLGSGLFELNAAKAAGRPVRVGLGSDVGGGTTLSMLQTAGEAYKVGQLHGRGLNAAEALHLMTLGGAEALGMADRLGSLEPGKEADIVVLDPGATPLIAQRTARSQSLLETLFVLMAMGDDRAVHSTYVAGRLAHARDGVTEAVR
jgi:guanine deaminase